MKKIQRKIYRQAGFEQYMKNWGNFKSDKNKTQNIMSVEVGEILARAEFTKQELIEIRDYLLEKAGWDLLKPQLEVKKQLLSTYKKSGMFDELGVEIIEGHVINADGYESTLDGLHCVEYYDGQFGSDIYSDFEPLSRYKNIRVVGHAEDYRDMWYSDTKDEIGGNIVAVLK